MKPFCEHPVVILNPAARKFCYTHSGVHIYIHNSHVAYFVEYTDICFNRFLPRRNDITPSNYEYSYVVDDDGTTLPLYICVPCGRCRVCRYRKSNELAARCVAETNEYDTVPYFITFTYNNDNVPCDGVRKADLQLFFKRLRTRLDNLGIVHEIRYLAVAEYGSKTFRPHYHVILWNFPKSEYFPNLTSVIRFLERCWSRYDLDANGKRIPLRDSSGAVMRFPSGRPRYSVSQIGFIKVMPVSDGCPAYVLKYMRKAPVVPDGKNPTFMLSSKRNGGIGSAWIKRQKDWFRNNPNALSLQLVDKVVSGRVVNMPITPYVKNLLLGTPSTVIPSKQYNNIKCFVNGYRNLMVLFEHLRNLDANSVDFLCMNRRVVFNSVYDLPLSPRIRECVQRLDFMDFSMPKRPSDYYSTFNYHDTMDAIYSHLDDLENLTEIILDYSDYSDYFADVEKFKALRYCAMVNCFKDAPVRSVDDFVAALDYRTKRDAHKEVF